LQATRTVCSRIRIVDRWQRLEPTIRTLSTAGCSTPSPFEKAEKTETEAVDSWCGSRLGEGPFKFRTRYRRKRVFGDVSQDRIARGCCRTTLLRWFVCFIQRERGTCGNVRDHPSTAGRDILGKRQICLKQMDEG
jgi:hypothetical protein